MGENCFTPINPLREEIVQYNLASIPLIYLDSTYNLVEMEFRGYCRNMPANAFLVVEYKEEVQHPLWTEINAELDSLKGNVSVATMPSIIKRRLVDKLEYAKELNENAKIECDAGNFAGATKKLGVAKSQVESFASMVKITRRISEADKASFLADSAAIVDKVNRLIEIIE